MAVPLDLHVPRDGDAAGLRYAAEVVAPQVHEHHVLGALLGVSLQLLGEPSVLGLGSAPAAGAGDGVRGKAAPGDAHEQLGAGAHDVVVGRADEEQVRAGVHAAERAVQRQAVEGAAVGAGGQVDRLAPCEDDLDRLAGGDRLLRVDDRTLERVAPQARADAGRLARRVRVHRHIPRGIHGLLDGCAEGRLVGGGTAGPLERLPHRALRDPVALLDPGRLRVERGDRRERVREVVEDEDQVGLKECRERHPHRVGSRERHGGLERGHRVVPQGADRAADESWHALDRERAPEGHERAQGVERIRRRHRGHRERAIPARLLDRPRLHARAGIVHREDPAGAHPEEAVPTQALAALDRLEQVSRPAVVEAEERADGGLEVGIARGAEEDRVRARRQPAHLAEADRVRHRHRASPFVSRADRSRE